jgi:hypothetical protein
MKVQVIGFDGASSEIEVPSQQEITEFMAQLQPVMDSFLQGDQIDLKEVSDGQVVTDKPRCHLCDRLIEDDESYCYGCRTFICEGHPQTPWGRHQPQEHDSTGPEFFEELGDPVG